MKLRLPAGTLAVLALLAFAAGLALLAQRGAPRARLRPPSPPGPAVVAVLPFENLSGDPQLELLASEIATRLLDALGAREEIDAVPRERTLDFKGTPSGIEAVAESLAADYVIAGAVGTRGGSLEVDVYLYRSGPRPALWADRLEWDAAAIDRIPGELAARIDALVVQR